MMFSELVYEVSNGVKLSNLVCKLILTWHIKFFNENIATF